MSVTVIPATPDDVQLLAQMNRFLIEDEGSANPMSIEELCQRMKLWLEDEYQAVLFYRAKKVVGYGLYKESSDEHFPENTLIHIRQFFIEPGQRGQGLGKAAFTLLVKDVFPRGSLLSVDVLTVNPSGQAFWQSLGFEPHYISLRRK